MTTPADVLHGAARWIGTHEQPAGSNNVPGITDWYGMRGSWCAMFVSRVFHDAGLPLPASSAKGFAWCSAGADWFRRQGRIVSARDARPGDVAFFEWGAGHTAGGLDHVGVVLENTGTGLVCIEGNVGDRVGIHRRNYGEVPEVGRPAYDGAPTTPTPPPIGSTPSSPTPGEEDEMAYAYRVATHETRGELWLLWGPPGQNPIYGKHLRTPDEFHLNVRLYAPADIGNQGALIDTVAELPPRP